MSSNTPHATENTEARKSLRTRIGRFVALLIPGLDDIREARPILAPVVLGWLVALTTAIATRPLVLASMGDQVPAAANIMQAVLWVTALAAPVVLLLKAGLLTAVGWAATVVANARIAPRLLLSVLLYAEVILLFQGVVTALIAHLSPGGMPSSPTDLQAPLSLGALVSPSRPVLWSMAQPLSIFHAGWFTFLVVAIRRCADSSWGGAVGLATFFWGLAIGFSALRAVIMM